MKFQFSIRRLLLAVPMFAIPFAVLRPLGVQGAAIATLIAVPLAGIALTIKRNQVGPVARLFLLSMLGAVAGFLCCPMISPPHRSGDEIPYVLTGAVVGWLVFNTFDNRSQKDG